MKGRRLDPRFVISGLLLLFAMLVLVGQLFRLHLGSNAKMKRDIARIRRCEQRLLAGRGTISDRRGEGNLLAINLGVRDVCADPSILLTNAAREQVTVELAKCLNVAPGDVQAQLQRGGRKWTMIQREVPEELAARIERLRLAGVFFEDKTVRYYPQGSFLCHVLGFVNREGLGSAGIELQADKFLRGCPGYMATAVNAIGDEVYRERSEYLPALSGAAVSLTVDQHIQYIVEKGLDELMQEHGAQGCWAIVERVRTGEILAMACRPAYDLNRFNEVSENAKLNRAIGHVYEPGSTFKIAVIAAALEEGTITPDNVFDCENGAWSYRGKILRDYHPYGRLTVADGVQKSSNIMAAKIALSLGDPRVHRYLTAFGIGQRLGIDLPGEEIGLLAPLNKWSAISATRIAIGQGVAVTALQMLNVMCALANGGRLMRPYVIREVRADNGCLLYQGRPRAIAQPVSAPTAATMRRLLIRVTEPGGTGTRAAVPGYTVAGKTGSAQKPEGGGYSSTKHMASFVGFLPAEDPEIAMIVVADEPQPYHTGGVVSAPAFGRMAGPIMRYLNVPPSSAPLIASARQGAP